MRISPLAQLVAFLVMNGLMANRAQAQGTVVFVTSILGASAKVTESNGFSGAGNALGNTVAGVAPGSQFLVQLYAAAGNVSKPAWLVPVGTPVNFRNGTMNGGYVQESGTTSLGWPVDVVVTIPATVLPTPGGSVTVQVRAWWAGTNGNTYTSWDDARTNASASSRMAWSPLLFIPVTGNPLSQPSGTPVNLTGLRGFQLGLGDWSYYYPGIACAPKNRVIPQGGSVSFTVGGYGAQPIWYQWRKNSISIPNATNPTFVITNVTVADSGSYDAVVGNEYDFLAGCTQTLTVYSFQLHSNPPSVPPGLYPGITINGLTGQTYTIQSKTNLAPAVAWDTVTNLTLTQPAHVWLDTSSHVRAPDAKTRFYRMLTP